MISLKHCSLTALVVAAGLTFGVPAHAADKVCKLAISGNDLIQYDKKELSVAADCTQVEVTLTHTGKLPREAMGHNWVLVKAGDVEAVANDGAAAGLQNNYLKPGDTRVIAHTKTIGGGQSDSVTFPLSKLEKGQSYMYLCSFPGHNALMHGTFKIG
jgi:azurin